ncbi:Metal tolerance protein 12 [Cytospora mali]|uniref:Zinc transporter n=1 Tax=Cytospora mali TaxID=578113 RepID=A0A194VHY2_CYTMA|nr:Metal tolerance protein 12 [Valsa mali]
MASTYVLPGTTMPHTHRQHAHTQSHGHGHGHGHGHSRPLSPASLGTLNRSFKMDTSSAGQVHTHDSDDHDHGHNYMHSHNHSEPLSHSHGSHSHGVNTFQPRQNAPNPLLTSNGWKTTSTPAGKQLITPTTSDLPAKYEAPEAKLSKPAHDHSADRSKFTKMLLPYTAKWPILHAVMTEKDSRRIFYFMSLNFFFMAIQAFYGYVTDSLGLLSDSIHMFFDCVALAVGLFASVASKWPPSSRFPYGFGKVETLSGFANGVFLVLISVEIMIEAFERIVEGRETKRLAELFIVSSLGLAVNLVGMAAFGHHHHGWDPLASFIIAVLIIGSAIPLIQSSARRLLLTIPDEIEYSLRDTLSGITALRGVANYSVPKFWIDDRASGAGAPGGRLMGVMHVVAARGADMGDVRDRVRSYFSERGIDITLQVEREGDTSCWCGAGKSPLSPRTPMTPTVGVSQTLKAR